MWRPAGFQAVVIAIASHSLSASALTFSAVIKLNFQIIQAKHNNDELYRTMALQPGCESNHYSQSYFLVNKVVLDDTYNLL